MLPKLTVGFLALVADGRDRRVQQPRQYDRRQRRSELPVEDALCDRTAIRTRSASTRTARRTAAAPPFRSAARSTTLDGPQYLAFDRASESLGDELQSQHEPGAADRVRGARDRQRVAAELDCADRAGRAASRLRRSSRRPTPSSSASPRAEHHGDRRQRSRPITYPSRDSALRRAARRRRISRSRVRVRV